MSLRINSYMIVHINRSPVLNKAGYTAQDAPSKKPTKITYKNNTGHTDGRTDGPTDGRTQPLIEMRRRI